MKSRLRQVEDQEEATPRQEHDRHSQELVGESELQNRTGHTVHLRQKKTMGGSGPTGE